jgi:HK97 family phage portal protein
VGFLSRLFGREAKAISSSDELMREIFGVTSAKSGQAVNYKTALEAVTALACVKKIADGLSQVPFKVFRKEDRKRLPAEDHPLFELLSVAPNHVQTSFEFREMIGMHLALCGNAFVWLNRVNGRIVEMLPFTPQEVAVKREANWELTYQISSVEGKSYTLPAADIWHLRGFSWCGWMGLEGVKLAREAIGLGLATEEHGARFFGNGAQLGGILSTDMNLDEKQRKELRESWEARHAGGQNAHKTAVLGGGMKFSPMTSPNDQAQFLETRKFQVEEVCRAFGVLPIMVGHSDKTATYASAEQMFLAHVVHTMGPWFARVEGSANMRLLTREERAKGYYTKFVVNGLMRGAAKDRGDFYTKLYSVGAFSPNDIRELEDLNPYDGGDEYRVPLNMVEPGTDAAAGTREDQDQSKGGDDAAP